MTYEIIERGSCKLGRTGVALHPYIVRKYEDGRVIRTVTCSCEPGRGTSRQPHSFVANRPRNCKGR